MFTTVKSYVDEVYQTLIAKPAKLAWEYIVKALSFCTGKEETKIEEGAGVIVEAVSDFGDSVVRKVKSKTLPSVFKKDEQVDRAIDLVESLEMVNDSEDLHEAFNAVEAAVKANPACARETCRALIKLVLRLQEIVSGEEDTRRVKVLINLTSKMKVTEDSKPENMTKKTLASILSNAEKETYKTHRYLSEEEAQSIIDTCL